VDFAWGFIALPLAASSQLRCRIITHSPSKRSPPVEALIGRALTHLNILYAPAR